LSLAVGVESEGQEQVAVVEAVVEEVEAT